MSTYFFSGMKRRRSFQRHLGVNKYCRRAYVKGLRGAVEDEMLESVTVRVDGRPIERFNVHGDHVYFWDLIVPDVVVESSWLGLVTRTRKRPKNLRIEVEVMYRDLERPVYTR